MACISDKANYLRCADATDRKVDTLASVNEKISNFLRHDRVAIQSQYPKSMTINREVESCETTTSDQFHPCNLRYVMNHNYMSQDENVKNSAKKL